MKEQNNLVMDSEIEKWKKIQKEGKIEATLL